MSKAKAFDISLRVVFYKEGRDWIAHCLEFDLLGDGRTKEKALQSLMKAVGLQLEESFAHRNVKNLFSPAPSEIWEMFALGSDTAVGNLSVCVEQIAAGPRRFSLGDVRLREYAEAKSGRQCQLV